LLPPATVAAIRRTLDGPAAEDPATDSDRAFETGAERASRVDGETAVGAAAAALRDEIAMLHSALERSSEIGRDDSSPLPSNRAGEQMRRQLAALERQLADLQGARTAAASPTNSLATKTPGGNAPDGPADPVLFTGSGDSVVAIAKPLGQTVVAATVTGNEAGRHFSVKALDGDRDTLVNTTEPYSGTALLDARRGGTTQLVVKGTGPWSITLSDVRSLPNVSTGSHTGTGDAVLSYEGSAGIAAISGNHAARHFAVTVYASSDRRSRSVVNSTDPYTGSVPWPAGPLLVAVKATGDWSIVIT
jgi:hypothetical protein